MQIRLRVARLPAVAGTLCAAAALLAGCTDPARDSSGSSPADTPAPGIVTVSDRDGPSWEGELGDEIRIDRYDLGTGKMMSEQVAVLAVKRVPNPYDDGGPDEFGDGYGPYEWKYGIKVRLTSLDERSARRPASYQFLQLSDGRHTEDGISGLGRARGPDPSRPRRSSVGWLYQWAEMGFQPTEVVLPIGIWQATWHLGPAPHAD